MQAEDLANRIAATFNSRPLRHGREYRVCCPVHEGDGGVHRPSLAVWESTPGRAALKCMTGCSRESVTAALAARGIRLGARLSTAQQLQAARQNEGRRVEQLLNAREAIMNAEPISTGDVVARYLGGRKLWPFQWPLRSIFSGHDPQATEKPAMISVVVDPVTVTDEKPRVTGVSILTLNRDGTAHTAPNGKKFRSIVGKYAGMGVPLGEPGPRLVVGEGVETTMAAMRLLHCGFGFATLSASNLPALRIPEMVETVEIAADGDEAGVEAAISLQEQLIKLGLSTLVRSWGEGQDAADAWAAR